MSRLADKRDIWVVSPVINNDGEIKIVGYTRLRKINIYCVPANGYIDSKIYGNKLDRTYKFNDTKPIDIAYNGGDGIYFEKPIVDEKDGMYKKPPFISLPLTHFGKQYMFNAEMQVY